jgi:Na+/proline symporter
MGWVILAMTKIIGVLFAVESPEGKLVAVGVCIGIALIYATIAGMWGVVATDLLQLVMATVGSFALAIISVEKLGGLRAMRAGIVRTIGEQSAKALDAGIVPLPGSDQLFDSLPGPEAGGLAIATFFIFVTVKWWAGAEGDGYMAQRIFACKSERDGALAVLWYALLHFVVRVWPWILVGLASIVFFPALSDAEEAYPRMIAFLPVGLRGVMIASLLAAFMSTIDTHLNWGSSYLVTDLYKRFRAPGRSAEHYVRVAQIASVLLMVLAGGTALAMDSIVGAWYFLSEVSSGLVLATLLRWLWWRVNAWSEITAMTASLVLANGFKWIGAVTGEPFFREDAFFPIRLVIIITVCTIAWIIVTVRTKPVSLTRLRAFYRRIRPPGFWGPVREEGDESPETGQGLRLLGAWASGTAAIYCLLVGTGKILLTEGSAGWVVIAAGVACGFFSLGSLDRREPRRARSR